MQGPLRDRGFGVDNACCGAFLHTLGCLGHPWLNPLEAGGSPSYDNPKCLQTSPSVPCGAEGGRSPLVENQ